MTAAHKPAASLPIHPRQGLGPVRFGMSPQDVAQVFGEPETSSPGDGCIYFYYANALNVAFRDDRAFLAGATRRAKGVSFEGLDIFEADPAEVLRRLERAAGSAVESYGFVIFPDLGVSLTGFHDDDWDQKAMTVSVDGEWDSVRSSFKPVSFPS